MRQFALRIDGLKATFFACIGVDRAARTFFHSPRIERHARINPLKKYGIREIAGSLVGLHFSHHKEQLAGLEKGGHEVQLHCFDHLEWSRKVEGADASRTEEMIHKGIQAFQEMLGRRPLGFAAPAFKVTEKVVSAEKKLGFLYASDYKVEGECKPFIPEGGILQIPVNLPLIEDLVTVGWSDEKILSHLEADFKTFELSVMYLHLCYEPLHKAGLLRKVMEAALSHAEPLTFKEIWRDWKD